LFRFFSKLLGNWKTTPPKTTTKNLAKKCSPQHNSGLCWNRPWPQNCSPNIVFVRHRIYKTCLRKEFGFHRDFHSRTSVSLDKLYQGSRNFSEQKFRFPWHKMKFTINWLFCPYRSNQHRSWTVLHSHLSYWSERMESWMERKDIANL
jgi:hypothetical protein